MSQKAVEIILMRQLASYLAMPILLFGPTGTLLFYNEPAEAIAGLRFDESGAVELDPTKKCHVTRPVECFVTVRTRLRCQVFILSRCYGDLGRFLTM